MNAPADPKIKFIVYSRSSAETIANEIGTPEYSYYFVLKEYLPLLRRFGEVEIVKNPKEEVDPIYRDCLERGQPCLFLHFSAPQNMINGIECPTVHVIAWEFDSIPIDTWRGEGFQDWRVGLTRSGAALTLSSHSVRVIKDTMGPDFLIEALPCPIWDRFERFREDGETKVPVKSYALEFFGVLVDSRHIDLFVHIPSHEEARAIDLENERKMLELKQQREAEEAARRSLWGRTRYRLAMAKGLTVRYLAELNTEVLGGALTGLKRSAGRRVGVLLSALARRLGKLKALLAAVLRNPLSPSAWRAGLDTAPAGTETAPSGEEEAPASDADIENSVYIDGVVYTAIMNPLDGRKNWRDMVTAFCWAFKDTPDATLLIKVSSPHIVIFSDELVDYLQRLAPFQCRIVVIKAYLEKSEYDKLIHGTTYYVNTSYGEGQSLPLSEFMSCGIPAIASAETAMSDYIDNESAFAVNAHAELTYWQHDPRKAFRTLHYRVDWLDLVEQYKRSYDIAKNDPEAYIRMGAAAAESLRKHCSMEVVSGKLAGFLEAARPIYESASGGTAPAAVSKEKEPSKL